MSDDETWAWIDDLLVELPPEMTACRDLVLAIRPTIDEIDATKIVTGDAIISLITGLVAAVAHLEAEVMTLRSEVRELKDE